MRVLGSRAWDLLSRMQFGIRLVIDVGMGENLGNQTEEEVKHETETGILGLYRGLMYQRFVVWPMRVGDGGLRAKNAGDNGLLLPKVIQGGAP